MVNIAMVPTPLPHFMIFFRLILMSEFIMVECLTQVLSSSTAGLASEVKELDSLIFTARWVNMELSLMDLTKNYVRAAAIANQP